MFQTLQKFDKSIKDNLPEGARIVHQGFLPSAASPIGCGQCQHKAFILAPDLAKDVKPQQIAIMFFIIEDKNWTPESPEELPRLRCYLTAECPTCNNATTGRFELTPDDVALFLELGVIDKIEEAPPTEQ